MAKTDTVKNQSGKIGQERNSKNLHLFPQTKKLLCSQSGNSDLTVNSGLFLYTLIYTRDICFLFTKIPKFVPKWRLSFYSVLVLSSYFSIISWPKPAAAEAVATLILTVSSLSNFRFFLRISSNFSVSSLFLRFNFDVK